MLPVAATNRLYSHVSALVAAAAVGRRRLQQLLLTGPSLRVLPLQPLHAAPAAMVPLSTAAVAAGGADIAGAKKVIRKEIIRTLKALSTDALALQSGFFESSVAGRHPCLHVTHHPSPPAMQHSTQHNTPSPCTHARMHPCTHANRTHAGAQIATHVVASRAFASARTVGVYIHCAKLHEVDTMRILEAALQRGALLTVVEG